MDLSEKIIAGHHAYLIPGTEEELSLGLDEFLNKEWKVKTKGNPDFSIRSFSVLKIEDSREIIDEVFIRPVAGDRRFFVVYFGSMTREAANAFLKIFEDPPEYAIFFAITPNPERLPATLRSRFYFIPLKRGKNLLLAKLAEKYMGFSIGEKISFAKKLSEEIASGEKSRSEAGLIFEAIEENLVSSFNLEVKNVRIYKDIEKCRSYLKDPSSSVKMIFEELALLAIELGVREGKVLN